jgi:DNA-binding transcriptional LysR family regulator
VLTAILEAGSFGRAAGILGLTQPVVSRALGRLEAGIGIRLLERTTHGQATEEGRQFYDRVAHSLDEIEDAVTTASGAASVTRGRLHVAEIRGKLRTCPPLENVAAMALSISSRLGNKSAGIFGQLPIFRID